MAGTPASDVVYDLVAIQYHALKGGQAYEKYLQDARGNEKVEQFLRRVKEEDHRRAQEAHELLRDLTQEGGMQAA